MLEIFALLAALLTIANLASARHMNVKLWVGVAAAGWLILAIVFRFLFPLGIVFALLGWALVLGIIGFVSFQKVPERVRTYEGLDELMKTMEEARAYRESKE